MTPDAEIVAALVVLLRRFLHRTGLQLIDVGGDWHVRLGEATFATRAEVRLALALLRAEAKKEGTPDAS